MEQTPNRISDERLADMADGKYVLFSQRKAVARELTTLRASHKRLVEALEGWQDHLVGSLNCMGAIEQRLFFEGRTALAEARKLEGK